MSNVIDVQKLSKEAGLSFGRDILSTLLVPGGAIYTKRKYARYEQSVLDVLDREGTQDDHDRDIYDEFKRRQSPKAGAFTYAFMGAMDLIKLHAYANIAYDVAKPLWE